MRKKKRDREKREVSSERIMKVSDEAKMRLRRNETGARGMPVLFTAEQNIMNSPSTE